MLREDFIRQYLVKDPPKRPNYKDAVDKKEELEVHFCNEYPKLLLDLERPNEEPKYKNYRELVYQSPTKAYASRVLTTLKKIRKAEDWSVKFTEESKAGKENLYDYTQVNYPIFDSVENWFFSIGIDQMVTDSNGVFAILPLPKNTLGDQEYLKPSVEYYESERVIDYKEGEYCVLLSNKKSIVYNGKTPIREGKVYIFIDKDSLLIAEQNGDINNPNPTFQVPANAIGELAPLVHNFGSMPAFMTGGAIAEYNEGDILNESFLAPCVPAWNESVRRYSDYQVCMVLKIYPKEWEIADVECGICKGSGKINNHNGGQSICSKCNGVGARTAKGPFGTIQVKPAFKAGVNESVSIPTPPGGIIDRDIESIKVIKEEYKDKILEGLSGVYMDFLIPAVNSGIAKEYDRQEINSFLNTVAAHIVNNILSPVYYYCAMWRYGNVKTTDQIQQLLPIINVPKKFDYITSFMAESKLQAAITGKFSPVIINKLQVNYMNNEFGEDSEDLKKMETEFMLDPLPNRPEDEKMSALSNKGCTLEDYVISTKLSDFINRAINENPDFLDMNYAEKNKIIKGYATAQISQVNSSVIPLVGADGGGQTLPT